MNAATRGQHLVMIIIDYFYSNDAKYLATVLWASRLKSDSSRPSQSDTHYCCGKQQQSRLRDWTLLLVSNQLV